MGLTGGRAPVGNAFADGCNDAVADYVGWRIAGTEFGGQHNLLCTRHFAEVVDAVDLTEFFQKSARPMALVDRDKTKNVRVEGGRWSHLRFLRGSGICRRRLMGMFRSWGDDAWGRWTDWLLKR